jgi:nitrate/TMAO reductase-like tetraheme cytochrome c subunit
MRRGLPPAIGVIVVIGLNGLIGCGGGKDLDRAALMDPESCKTCHPEHYREWSGSMHAYASEDPVFIAMNARGQRETNGELGDFCVQCHAPMAVREGLTSDGLDLDALPKAMKGVTCFFCHTAVGTTDDHNAAVELADDLVMRGGLEDPIDNDAHEAEYATHFDRNNLESSNVCGSCHDIVTPKGVELERTFREWRESLFAHENPAEKNTCQSCHMQGRDGVAADFDGVPFRRVHDHRFVGVDVALTDFPEKEDQRERIQFELDPTVIVQVCVMRVQAGLRVTIDLENFAAGHSWPSGAAQDRRAWVEVRAFLGAAEVFVSGASWEEPDTWRIGDETFDEEGNPVHMFWEVAEVRSNLLMAPRAQIGQPDYIDTHVKRTFDLTTVADRIETAVHIQPIGRDVLQDLVDSGDLDPVFLDRVETFTLGASRVVWRAEEGKNCVPDL